MSNPFTIQIFSTNGDPQGTRIIHKTNWSGVGVVFYRENLSEVIKEDYAKSPGVYILVGDLAEETVYIGEADPIAVRLKQHLQKDWSWGVFFVDSHGLGKTEIQFLESELVKIAQNCGSSILMNRNFPNPPNMSRQSQAAAQVFLNEVLLILPLIGIKAFSFPKKGTLSQSKSQLRTKTIGGKWDTIVIPAKADGFNNVFMGQDCWYAIRINSKEINKFKYIAAYQVAPISAITHIAEIKEIVPYLNSGKFLVRFKTKAQELKRPVRLQRGQVGSQPQSPRYTTYEKILNSDNLQDLW